MDNFLAIDAPFTVRMTFCFFVGGLDMNEAKEDTIHEMRSVISKFSKWPKSGATAILNENGCKRMSSFKLQASIRQRHGIIHGVLQVTCRKHFKLQYWYFFGIELHRILHPQAGGQ
jgi:hypothetical protein